MQPTNPENPNATTPEASNETLHDLVTPESSPLTPPVSEGTSNLELRDGETARDALQREVNTVIEGAGEYAEKHYRDDGTWGLKQIELSIPNSDGTESREKIIIGYFAKDPKKSQLITAVRPLSPTEFPLMYATNVMEQAGAMPVGQAITDYELLPGQQELVARTTKFKGFPWEEDRMFDQSEKTVNEEGLERLRNAIASSTVEGKKGKPNLQISTLLQGSPVSPTPNTGV